MMSGPLLTGYTQVYVFWMISAQHRNFVDLPLHEAGSLAAVHGTERPTTEWLHPASG